jgi:DNA repair exonuclease SbcCD ATPase subunit
MNVCIPFADRELKLIYTLGKEEKQINVYDYSESTFKRIHSFNSIENPIYSVKFEGRYSDNYKIEIAKFARYSKSNNKIYYVSFIPNNPEEFLDILSPITEIKKPKITFEQWIKLKNDINLNDIQNKTQIIDKNTPVENNIKINDETNKRNIIKDNKEKKFEKRNTCKFLNKIEIFEDINKKEELKKNLANEEKTNSIIEEPDQSLINNIKDKEEIIKQYNEKIKKLEAELSSLENQYKMDKQKIIGDNNNKIKELENIIEKKEKESKAIIEYLENKNKKTENKFYEINKSYKELDKKYNDKNKHYIELERKNKLLENKVNEEKENYKKLEKKSN